MDEPSTTQSNTQQQNIDNGESLPSFMNVQNLVPDTEYSI